MDLKRALVTTLVLSMALGFQGCSSRQTSTTSGSTQEGQATEPDLYPFEEEFGLDPEVAEPDNETLARESDEADIVLCKGMRKLDSEFTSFETLLVGLDDVLETRSYASLENPKMHNQFKKFSAATRDYLNGSGTVEDARLELTKAMVACYKIGIPIGSE